MIVKEIDDLGNGTVTVKTKVIDSTEKDITFDLPEKSVRNCDVKPGTEIKVNKNNAGYTLNANNKVIGIIPNEKGVEYFKQQKQ